MNWRLGMNKMEILVRQFRLALDTAWEDGMFRKLYPFNNFPNDCCGHTCDLLSQYLLEHGIKTKQVSINGYRKNRRKLYGAWLYRI